ncbi:microtubule binding protein [Malassezia pachydermatis]
MYRNRNAAGMLKGSGPSALSKTGRSPSVVGASRKVGENKLLSKSNRFSPLGVQCKLCKQRVTQEKAQYCQACAYKKGLCAICGKQILDTSRYKQSS